MRKISVFFSIIGFFFLFIPVGNVLALERSFVLPPRSLDRTFVPGRIIVKKRTTALSLKSRLPLSYRDSLREEYPLIKSGTVKDMVGLKRIVVVETIPGKEKELIDLFRRDPDVEYAEPDYIANAASIAPVIPSDPYYKKDINGLDLWYRRYLLMEYAWGTTLGSRDVVIATVDSGIDSDHPDLQSKLWTNPREIAGNNLDDDGNGYLDDIHGWNVNQKNNQTDDDVGHGTMVAGIAGAATGNMVGITGVAWENPILPVKANVPNTVLFNYSDITKAITYADSFPEVRVINVSVGGYTNASYLRDAVANVLANNKSVIVAGVGNDGVDIFTTPFYPASYRGVLAVGAHANGLARVYNYGYPMAVSAPGNAIYTTFMGGDYGYGSGTSFATPFVSGAVALLASRYPQWTARELSQGVKFWADCPPDSENCQTKNWSLQYGFGTLTAQMALVAGCHNGPGELRTTIVITSPGERASLPRLQKVDITGTVVSSNFFRYVVEYGAGVDPTEWKQDGMTLPNDGQQQIENGVIASWDLSKIPDPGNYQYRIRIFGNATCRDSLTGDERAVVTVY